MIKIAIVDDNSFLITAAKDKLSLYEDIQIKFTATDGKDTLDKIGNHLPLDLILMDIEMPKINGIEATRHIKQKYPHIKIVMLTVFDNDENIFNAIKAGADGYLLKEVNPKDLYQGILHTLEGGATMTPSIAMKTLQLLKNPLEVIQKSTDELIELSKREIEVLEQLSKGLKNKDIADSLFISAATVKKHVENIYKKLQAHNRIELLQKAKENRLL
jgi:DNA-binding NarL/FixJ family response regulator